MANFDGTNPDQDVVFVLEYYNCNRKGFNLDVDKYIDFASKFKDASRSLE